MKTKITKGAPLSISSGQFWTSDLSSQRSLPDSLKFACVVAMQRNWEWKINSWKWTGFRSRSRQNSSRNLLKRRDIWRGRKNTLHLIAISRPQEAVLGKTWFNSVKAAKVAQIDGSLKLRLFKTTKWRVPCHSQRRELGKTETYPKKTGWNGSDWHFLTVRRSKMERAIVIGPSADPAPNRNEVAINHSGTNNQTEEPASIKRLLYHPRRLIDWPPIPKERGARVRSNQVKMLK